MRVSSTCGVPSYTGAMSALNSPNLPAARTAPGLVPAAGAPSRLAWALGIAGLFPFVAGAALQWFSPPGWRMLAASALLTYGAVIVSFLGGIHWGLAMRTATPANARLVWGVIPSLLGWLAILLDAPWGHVVLTLSLLACLAVDRAVYRTMGLSAWLPLRAVLTVVAGLSVAVGGWAYWVG